MAAQDDDATLREMKNNFAVTAYRYLREQPPWV